MAAPLDSDDLVLAQQGDPAAFERLIRPYLPAVRRFAYSFCRDWAAADDLAQDALLKAFRSIRSFRGEASLGTWLYSVARTTFLDMRRGHLGKCRELEAELPDGSPADEPGADELLASRGDAERLWRAIRRLEPRFRIPLVLFEIEGMSYEHVAAIEQVPVGTIRSRLSRARAKLLEQLNAEELDGVSATSGTAEGNPSSHAVRRPYP